MNICTRPWLRANNLRITLAFDRPATWKNPPTAALVMVGPSFQPNESSPVRDERDRWQSTAFCRPGGTWFVLPYGLPSAEALGYFQRRARSQVRQLQYGRGAVRTPLPYLLLCYRVGKICAPERGDANFAITAKRCVLGDNWRNSLLHPGGMRGATRHIELQAVTARHSLPTVRGSVENVFSLRGRFPAMAPVVFQ